MHGKVPVARVLSASAADMASQLMLCLAECVSRIVSRPAELTKKYFIFCPALFYIEKAA